MPRGISNSEPPEAMTWSKAVPIIVVAGILDLTRMFFEMFWFFGPALAALWCTDVVNTTFGMTVAGVGGKIAATGCSVAAATAGFFGIELTETFGAIMADAVGLAAFLILSFWLLMGNKRIFTLNNGNWFWLIGSLGVSIIPFIGTFPAFSVVLLRLYGRQIKIETATLNKWKKEQIEIRQQEREWQAIQLMQLREAQLSQIETQETGNDDSYMETVPGEEIPEEMFKAA